MWDSPRPEIWHMSPALEGFLSTAPLRRSLWLLLKHSVSVGFLWHHADSRKETAISLPPGGSRSPGSPADLHCHLRRDTLHLPLEEVRVLAPHTTSTCTMGRVSFITASQWWKAWHPTWPALTPYWQVDCGASTSLMRVHEVPLGLCGHRRTAVFLWCLHEVGWFSRS